MIIIRMNQILDFVKSAIKSLSIKTIKLLVSNSLMVNLFLF